MFTLLHCIAIDILHHYAIIEIWVLILDCHNILVTLEFQGV